MGIQGLLQGLKFATRAGNITDYKGQAICVDGSSWLHKSVYSIADHYVECTERGTLDKKSINIAAAYIRSRCDELLKYAQVRQIYFVMDGKRCPLKAGTNADRDSRREDNLKEARRLKQRGDKDGAFEKYKACIKITVELTKEVAANLARAFPDGRVKLVQAPYEADPQLVKLCMDGHCNAIITEDSDVLVYCAAARRSIPILFKLDRKNGQCQVVSMDWLFCQQNNLSLKASLTGDNSKKKSNGIEATLEAFAMRETREPGLGARLFVQSCILSGCDYAANELDGVGLVNAFKAIRGAIHRENEDRFRHAMTLLPSKACKNIVMIDYEELLAKSEAVFFFHPVVEATGRVCYLLDPEDSSPHLPSLGRFGGDTSFIGDPTTMTQQSAVHLRPSNKASGSSAPPVAEITVGRSDKRARHHKPASSFDEGLRRSKEVVPILNPYMNSKKRAHDGSQVASAQLSAKHNPFASFMAKGKENMKPKSELAKCLEDTRDYRCVQSSAKGIGVKAHLEKLNQEELARANASQHAPDRQPMPFEHERRPIESDWVDAQDNNRPSSSRFPVDLSERHDRCMADRSHGTLAHADPLITGDESMSTHFRHGVDRPSNSRNQELYDRCQVGVSHATAAHSCQSIAGGESTHQLEHLVRRPESDSHRPNHRHNAQPYRASATASSAVALGMFEDHDGHRPYSAPAVYDLCGSDSLPANPGRYHDTAAGDATFPSYDAHAETDADDLSEAPSQHFVQPPFLSSPKQRGLFQSAVQNDPVAYRPTFGDESHPFEVDDPSVASKGMLRFQPDAGMTKDFSLNPRGLELPRRITYDSRPEPEVIDVDNLQILPSYESPKKPLFEYDDWMASPQAKDHVMTSVELHADDINSSPDLFARPYPINDAKRHKPIPTNTIGPAKVFRNRFQSSSVQVARTGLFSSRGKKGAGLIQGTLSTFFSGRN